jgi:hypothetical protein
MAQTETVKTEIGNMANGMTAPTFDSPAILATLVWFAIPIILMHMAMKAGEKMSSELSSSATKFGGEAGKWVAKKAWHMTPGSAWMEGKSRGVANAWKNRTAWYLPSSDKKRETAVNASAETMERGLAGGFSGYENAKHENFNKEVTAEQERLKKLGNVTEAEALLKNKKSSKVQKKAAALYLAEKEKIGSGETLKLAMQAAGQDTSAMKKVLDGTSEAVLKQDNGLVDVMRHLQASGVEGDDLYKMQVAAMAKFGKKGLGADSAQYETILDAISTNKNDEKRKEFQKKYNKRLTEEGMAHIRLESEKKALKAADDEDVRTGKSAAPKSAAQLQKEAYVKIYGDMGFDSIAKQQDKDALTGDFMKYMKERVGGDHEKAKQLSGALGRNDIGSDARKQWDTHADSPVGNAAQLPTATLKVVKSSFAIPGRKRIDIEWSSTNAVKCVGSGSGLSEWDKDLPALSGKIRVEVSTVPATKYTFTLTVTGTDGSVVTKRKSEDIP